MNLKIKEITEKEIAASAEIIRQSFKTVADEFNLTPENASTNGAFLKDERLLDEYRRGIKMFGLYEDETQIGFAAIESGDGISFYLEKLAVLPERRHNGGGKMLMDYVKNYITEANGKEILIGIIYENKRLLNWYKSFGFVETGTKVFEHLPFTVCFMRFAI